MDNRQVECIGQINEAFHLAGGCRCPQATQNHRVARHDPDRISVDPRKAGDNGRAVLPTNLEETPLIHDGFDDRTDLVEVPQIARDRFDQELFTTIRLVQVGLRSGSSWIDDGR